MKQYHLTASCILVCSLICLFIVPALINAQQNENVVPPIKTEQNIKLKRFSENENMKNAIEGRVIVFDPLQYKKVIPAKDDKNKSIERQKQDASSGWQTIKDEDFEGAFPNNWDVYVKSGDYADAYWGVTTYKEYTGSHSCYCANNGTDGTSDGLFQYVDNMMAWMKYGPFDLSDASDAEAVFYHWTETVGSNDKFYYGASIDGEHFYVRHFTGDHTDDPGNENGWLKHNFNFKNVYQLGDLTGESQVWFAFVFITDEGGNSRGGTYIDNVTISKEVPPAEPVVFDFDDGTTQGWRGEDIRPRNWNEFIFVWDDYIDYPDFPYDDLGNNLGTISLQTTEPVTESEEVVLEFRSPDLSINSDWQNARGWTADILFMGNLTPIQSSSPYTFVELPSGHERMTGEVLEVYGGSGWHKISVQFPEDVSAYKWLGLRIEYPEGLSNIEGGVFLDNIEPLYQSSFLAAPSNLSLTAVSNSQINLSWQDNSSNESGFKIQRKEGLDGNWSTVHTTSANVILYQDTELRENTRYYYRVYAYNSAGNSGFSNESNAATQQTETDIIFDFDDGTIQEWRLVGAFNEHGHGPFSHDFSELLWWDHASYPNAPNSDPVGDNNGSIVFHRIQDTYPISIPDGEWCLMQLYSPDLESYNNWKNAKGYAVKFLTSCTYGNRTVYADLNVYIHDHNQGIDRSYSISKVALPRHSWKDIKFVFGSISHFPSNYTVKHIWINIWFKKGDLIEGSVWLDDIEPLIEVELLKPKAPGNFSATAVSSSQINLIWQDNSSNESGFKIQRKEGLDVSWSTIHTTSDNATSYQNTGLNANTTYSYRVYAYNNYGNSAHSNTATAVTLGESLPDDWNFAENTGNNATIVLPTSANPNIKGTPLLNGDFIGVFTEAELCCGYDVWNNQTLAITLWGDDDQTPAVDGFKGGEEIHYRIYRPSEQQEWTNVSTGYSKDDGTYSTNAYMILNKFEVLSNKTITLHFSQGWNMFSYNVAVQDARPEAVFGSIADKVKIVKNGQGKPYIPEHGIDNIEEMSFKEGYLGYFLNQTDLEISGHTVDPQTPIELKAGWNMIGFLPEHSVNAKVALASIVDHLVMAKDGKGQTFIPEFDINGIGEMKPGCGYLVYLEEKGTLIYPAVPASNNTLAMGKTSAKNGLLEHFQFSANTSENATVVVPIDADPRYPDGSSLQHGDEIGVFTSQGLCCGASLWEEANSAITVWGDDPMTSDVDGFKAGDTLYYRLWEKSKDIEYWATAVYKNNDPINYKANGFSVIENLFATLTDIGAFDESMPQTFSLHQNYPNPFNPTTKITFSLAGSSDITLTVYNLNGQKVRTLVQQNLPSGHHSIQWDARDELGTPVSSGTYFYRLTVQQGSKRMVDVRKMTLMR